MSNLLTQLVEELNAGKMPIWEPGLEALAVKIPDAHLARIEVSDSRSAPRVPPAAKIAAMRQRAITL